MPVFLEPYRRVGKNDGYDGRWIQVTKPLTMTHKEGMFVGQYQGDLVSLDDPAVKHLTSTEALEPIGFIQQIPGKTIIKPGEFVYVLMDKTLYATLPCAKTDAEGIEVVKNWEAGDAVGIDYVDGVRFLSKNVPNRFLRVYDIQRPGYGWITVMYTDPQGTGTIIDQTPSASPDTETVVEGVTTPVSGNILDNDTVPAGGKTVTSFKDDNFVDFGQAFATPKGGSLTVWSDGWYEYTPPSSEDHSGGAVTEQFEYTLTDANGQTASSTLTITIEDTAPTANDDLHRFFVTEPETVVTGNVIAGMGGGADVPSQDTPLSVTGWYEGNEAQNLSFGPPEIGVWKALASGNEFRWVNADDGTFKGDYEYKIVNDQWNVLYDKDTQPILQTPELRADSIDDNLTGPVQNILDPDADLNAKLYYGDFGLSVQATVSGDSKQWIDFTRLEVDDDGTVYSESEVLFVDLGGDHSFIKLGLRERTDEDPNGSLDPEDNFNRSPDQFVLDLYDAGGNLIGTDNNGGEFFLVEDFPSDDPEIRSFTINGAPVFARYVGIRSMPTEEEWARQSDPIDADNLKMNSSAFAVTHISVNTPGTGDQVTYQLSDSDGSKDVATLTLAPLYP